MKIIIIDDNKPFRESLKFFLELKLGHKVVAEAPDGIEFLKLENLNEADVILMDIEMPNINGIQAVQIAKGTNLNLKFIAVTSYSDHVYLMDLLNNGFNGCVFKNNINKELKIALEELSNQRKYFPKEIKIIYKNSIQTNISK